LAIARGAGQRRNAAAAAAGADQPDGPAERRSTIDLLRKLGGAE